MQKNSSENPAKGPAKALKFALIGFVALSISTAIYKIASSPAKAGPEAAGAAATAAGPARPAVKPEPETSAAAKPAAKAAVETKTAVVYYFHTNARCSSCMTIEAYTREAVSARLAAGYKDWKVEFKSVNVDEKPNEHYVQDYWLNTKSVVVQKFAGDKPLKWGKLDKVWQLLGDKEGFMNYIAAETQKLLDEK